MSFDADSACRMPSMVPAVCYQFGHDYGDFAPCPASSQVVVSKPKSSDSRRHAVFLVHKRLHMLKSCYIFLSQILTVSKLPRLPIWTYYVIYGKLPSDWLYDYENETSSVVV